MNSNIRYLSIFNNIFYTFHHLFRLFLSVAETGRRNRIRRIQYSRLILVSTYTTCSVAEVPETL